VFAPVPMMIKKNTTKRNFLHATLPPAKKDRLAKFPRKTPSKKIKKN